MKLRIVIDVEVSDTIAETMQRTGFLIEPDGSAMKIKIPNTPTIPKRKTKVTFLKDHQPSADEAITASK